MLQDYAGEFVLSSPPRLLQKVLFGLLAPLCRLRGYRGRYERYSRLGDEPPAVLPFKRHTARASEWIDRPPRDMFGYIANYDNDAQWRSIVSMTQVPTGETRAGTITRRSSIFSASVMSSSPGSP